MTVRNREVRKANQEQALLDYVHRIARLRAGRRAIHLHFSLLRPRHRQEHHLRFAATILERFARKFDGALFWLSNDDMVLVAKDTAMAELDEAVLRLRLLFGDDPLLSGEGREAAFCGWFNLESDYDALLGTAQALQITPQDPPPASPFGGISAAADAGAKSVPLDPSHLAQIERSIANADLSNFMRRQSICFIAPGQPPISLFEELYISVPDLRRAVLPECDISADCWLFQHLTRILDLRMLAMLARRGSGIPLRDFSINLNIATILASEFLDFDTDINSANRGTIAIELQQIDIFADIDNFMFVRDYLKERDYKLCLDGVKHQMLPLVDREGLGVDLVKFQWGPDLVDDLDGPRGTALKESVKRIGRDRLVLCRCDSALSVEVGAALGITMYQGRYFDGLLRPATGTATPAPSVGQPVP